MPIVKAERTEPVPRGKPEPRREPRRTAKPLPESNRPGWFSSPPEGTGFSVFTSASRSHSTPRGPRWTRRPPARRASPSAERIVMSRQKRVQLSWRARRPSGRHDVADGLETRPPPKRPATVVTALRGAPSRNGFEAPPVEAIVAAEAAWLAILKRDHPKYSWAFLAVKSKAFSSP